MKENVGVVNSKGDRTKQATIYWTAMKALRGNWLMLVID